MWEQSKTVFVTVNLPGGSNNDTDAWYGVANPNHGAAGRGDGARTAADLRWLNAAFAMAEADNAHSVVIIGQADMWDTSDAAAHQTNYEPIVEAIADNTTAYRQAGAVPQRRLARLPLRQPAPAGLDLLHRESGACTADAWKPAPVLRRAGTSTASSSTARRSRSSG